MHHEEPNLGSYTEFVFSEDELVELELLRNQEINSFVEQGLLPKGDRWNTERREQFVFE